MGIVPGWLISPIPVATYAIIPLIAAKSPIVPFILSLPALPRDLFFSFVDGFSRTFGITTLGVDSVLSHSHPGLRNSPWSMVLVATIAGGGGGLLVPAFRLFSPEWGFNATPPWVTHGPGIDVWGATVIGYVYATLIDAHPFFRLLPNYIYTLFPFLNSIVHLPKNYLSAAGSQPLLPNNEAKVACSLLLASMLMTKTLYPYFTALFKKSPKAKKSSGGSTAVAPVGKSTAIAPVSTNGAVKKNKDKPKKA
ncbi:hypothetical protein MNV49_007760 [Pseudohyphozyma bogoriensis]|nr:hypothetical protein MNV49_007760 [Pseudohyphozyma bogoriensis]